jgi:putative ABC transport system permease protein
VGIGNYATVSTGTELILTTPEFSRVYDPIAQYTAHLVQLGPSTTAQQVIDAAAAAGRGEFSVTTDTPSRVEAYRASVRPDVVGLQVFSGVAALVAILVLGSLLGREAAVTGADHAVRRALGMTRGQLLAIHLSRIGITASGGVAVGSALAVALSGLLVRGSTRSVDPDKGVRIEVLVLLLGALIMLVSPILCAIPAVRRVVDTRPASTPKTSHVAQRFAASGAPVTFALGVGHAFGSGSGRTTLPSRTASVVAGLAVGVAAAAGLFAVNVDRLVADPAQYGVTWNVVLGSTFDPNRDCPTSDPQCEGGPVLEQRSSELAAFVQGRVGIRASTPYTTATIAVDGQADLTIVGFGDGGVRPVILSGVEPRDGDLAMGAVELRDRHLHVGDTIVTGDGTALRIVGTAITAAGTHDSSPELGHGAITTYATAQSLVTAPTDTGFLVAVDEDTAAALTRAFHAEFTTDAFSISPARDPREIIDYRRIRATPAALAIVVAAMAIATLALGVASSLQRRRRDVAVLRALGITTRQAIAIAVFHAAASAGLVLVGGTAIGLAAGRSVWTAVARHLGTEGATTWPSMTLAVAMSCTVLTVSAALILPCRQAARSPAGELLRVE